MNPGDRGLDWSDSRPGGAAVAGAGYKFAFCYVSPGQNKKNIDAGELADLHAHGIEVGLYFESSANRMLSGYAAGVADAAVAFADRDALGLTCPIWFADDENNPGADASKMPYCAGVASHGQPWEVYGSGHLIDLVALEFARTHGGHVSSWGRTVNAGFTQQADYHGPIPGTDDLTLVKADTLTSSPAPPAVKENEMFVMIDDNPQHHRNTLLLGNLCAIDLGEGVNQPFGVAHEATGLADAKVPFAVWPEAKCAAILATPNIRHITGP